MPLWSRDRTSGTSGLTRDSSSRIRLGFASCTTCKAQTAFPPGVQGYRVAAADLDGNGFPDVVLDGVAWLQTGGVWTQAPAPAPPSIRWHQLADVDSDGFPELLTEFGWYQGSQCH